MAQLGKLPNMAKAFNKLKICLELENLPNNSLIVSAIHKALARKDNDAAIEVVRLHAADDRQAVVDCVGEELVQKIESL